MRRWDDKDKRWEKRIAIQENIGKLMVIGGMIALVEVLGIAFLEIYLATA